MGTLLTKFLPKLIKVLICGVVKLSKLFMSHLRKGDCEDIEMVSENESESSGDEANEVYKNINK